MLNPTGGLVYHWRAARYGNTLWAPFRTALAAWLRDWGTSGKTIIVIGAGGGRMLPADFLSRFERVVAVDPDPLARFIFRRRFRALPVNVHGDGRDYFRFPALSDRDFRNLLAGEPDAAVLFSNFWGQAGFLVDDEPRRDRALRFWQDRLSRLLGDRDWASYHDRYSGSGAATDVTRLVSDRKLQGDDLIRRFCGAAHAGAWSDHLTGPLFPEEGRYDYFLWRILPERVHLIEGVYGRGA